MTYHILRTFETGAIVVNGQVRLRRYEYICRLHDPIAMIDGTTQEGTTVEVYSTCPTCGMTILQGHYDNESISS